MSVPVRTRAEVLRVLDGSSPAPGSVLARCIAAVHATGKDNYTWAVKPAGRLASTTALNIKIGRRGGQTYIGDQELLDRLRELGDRRVSLVFADQDRQQFLIYCDTETGEPLAAMIVGPDPDDS